MGTATSDPSLSIIFSIVSPALCLLNALLTSEHLLALVSWCTFLAPALESAVSLRSLGSFYWGRIFRSQDLGNQVYASLLVCWQVFKNRNETPMQENKQEPQGELHVPFS